MTEPTAATELDSDWEQNGCPLCDAASEHAAIVASFAESSYRRCNRCGLVYLSPRLREERMLSLYQRGDYFSGQGELGYETYEADAAVYHRTFERRLDEIRPCRPGGRLLDIGCGTGMLVASALARGYDAQGLDASDYAISAQDSELGGRVRVGTLASAGYPDSSFDVVTMMDVFEHLYDPRGFVGELARILSPDGIVAIATPDYDSWLRKLLGRRTVSFKIPEHVTYYTRETLGSAVSGHFAIRRCMPIGQYCTMDFLGRRLGGVAPWIGRAFDRAARWSGATAWQPYVPSGSMLAILTRHRQPSDIQPSTSGRAHPES